MQSTAIWDLMMQPSYRPLSIWGLQSAEAIVWLEESILSFNCTAYRVPSEEDSSDPGMVLLAAVGEIIDLPFLALQMGEGQVLLFSQEEFAAAFVVGPIQVRGVALGGMMGQPLGSSRVRSQGCMRDARVWGAWSSG
jgi:hypothetical protein